MHGWKSIALILLALVAESPNLSAGDPVLVGAGDIAKCGSRLKAAESTAALIDRVVRDASAEDPATPVVVFTLGDTVYPRGKTREFENCYQPTWGRHKDRTRPAIGNHEYGSRGGAPYFQYFGEAAGPAGLGYYSYDLGDWHIVVLNTACRHIGGCTPGSPQLEWLRQDLRQNGRPCTLAYFHHPLWSTGAHGRSEKVKPLYEVLYEYGAEAVLSGHDHHYERFAPQDPQGVLEPERGIRQFVVGTGGRGSRWYRRETPRGGGNSEVASSKVTGVLKLTLGADSYSWEFLSVDGKFKDTGTQACHLP